MDARLQRRVQRYGWDKAVGDYEAGWRAQLEPAQSLMLEMAALRPGERVLDVASGTGLVSFRIADAVGAVGFTDIRSERLQVTLAYASADAALGAAFRGGPVALAYSRFDDATKQQVHTEYLRSIAAYRTGEEYRIPGEFVVATGVKPQSAISIRTTGANRTG